MIDTILERYYLGAAALIVIIFLITFISAANTYIDDKNRNKSKKKYFKIDFYFAILIAIVASIWYQSSKFELIEDFMNGKNIICKQTKEFVIINKDKNYILKDDYFIKDNRAIDIDKCKILREQE